MRLFAQQSQCLLARSGPQDQSQSSNQLSFINKVHYHIERFPACNIQPGIPDLLIQKGIEETLDHLVAVGTEVGRNR